MLQNYENFYEFKDFVTIIFLKIFLFSSTIFKTCLLGGQLGTHHQFQACQGLSQDFLVY